MSEQPRDLELRTKAFALRVSDLYSKLPKNHTVAQVLGKQVLRSGTSVGANYREASRGRSKAEFISKIGDCLIRATPFPSPVPPPFHSGAASGAAYSSRTPSLRRITRKPILFDSFFGNADFLQH